MSEEVSPRWMNRPSSPTFSVTEVRKAITSCLVVFSISSILSTSNPAFSLMFRRDVLGDLPPLGHGLAGQQFDIKPLPVTVFRTPDGGHPSRRISRYQSILLIGVGKRVVRLIPGPFTAENPPRRLPMYYDSPG